MHNKLVNCEENKCVMYTCTINKKNKQQVSQRKKMSCREPHPSL